MKINHSRLTTVAGIFDNARGIVPDSDIDTMYEISKKYELNPHQIHGDDLILTSKSYNIIRLTARYSQGNKSWSVTLGWANKNVGTHDYTNESKTLVEALSESHNEMTKAMRQAYMSIDTDIDLAKRLVIS
jgi:hypothetical protein